ncbi:MAG: DUF1611 domain-containing protein [Rhodothermales bacterium]|nr:DUF1611 domain-containing protein [Rhodothermales bacterium]MBO6780687.1 DUF1611 domain-containing protein [Rhodothermales bacterium]
MMDLPPIPAAAAVFTNGLLDRDFAKTCHGLLRGSARFRPLVVLDRKFAGRDAGEVMDGRPRGVPVYATLEEWLGEGNPNPSYFVVGVAFSGGRLPASCRPDILDALARGMTVVCGLHQLLGDDPELAAAARAGGGRLVDIRRPKPVAHLRFWTGSIYGIGAQVVGVLGTDCAVGKRTTCRFLWEACNQAGIRAEMIYTGQTGWMQGYPFGFIFDATLNDFVGGELEGAIVACDQATSPELILVEGQGALRNPSGPCGSEIMLSGNARHIVLQHAPGRSTFVDQEALGTRLPTVEQEMALIAAYGSRVVAVTLNGEGMDSSQLDAYHNDLQSRLDVPVVQPLRDGVARLVDVLRTEVLS